MVAQSTTSLVCRLIDSLASKGEQVKKGDEVFGQMRRIEGVVSIRLLLITRFPTCDFSESKSKKAEKMSATTSTQTPMVSGDASSGSSVVAKKSAVVSADSIANKSQKGIVGGEVNGVSAMKEKKINLKVTPRRQSNFYGSTPCFRHTSTNSLLVDSRSFVPRSLADRQLEARFRVGSQGLDRASG